MDRKTERENFWISVGPESGYLGTIAEETARKNSGGISPDGERLGWNNAKTKDDDYGNGVAEGWDADDIATEFPYGDPCDAATNGMCGDCDCNGEDTTCAPCKCDPCKCEPCDCPPCERSATQPRHTQDNSTSGGLEIGYVPLFGANNEYSTLPLPGMIPIEQCKDVPLPDIGPEWQNTQE